VVTSIIQLYLSGQDSFTSNQEWIREVTGTLFCPHCHNVYASVDRVDAVVQPSRRQTDLDVIAMYCYRVEVLSTHFIDLVGAALVKQTASLGTLSDADGVEYERYRTAVARRDSVIIRGAEASRVKLCPECSRLLYWPIGSRYVLRQNLPRTPLFFSDGHLFCTAEFYEERIRHAELRRVASRRVLVLDKPLDGLPAELGELKAHLRRNA
jgi:hypothetical protein